MNDKKILILDYSTSRIEASAIGRWMPTDAEAISLYIDSEASFPTDLIERGFTHVIHSGSECSIVEEHPFTKRAVAFIQDARGQGSRSNGDMLRASTYLFGLGGEAGGAEMSKWF